ncbi:MAG TPA: adenylate/guanylate cyclase domain-containing protein [Chthoniobacterales bacterium]
MEAAQCAIEIQRALIKRNADVPPDRRIELKIGIHIGDVVHRGGDVYGDGVNIASRIEPLAGAGGICVSMDVERQIRNAVETRFEKLAPTELKNISVPMELFRIVLPWEKQSEVSGSATAGKLRSAVREKVAAPTNRRFALIGTLLLLLVIGIVWWWTTRSHKTLAPRKSESATTSSNVTAPISEKSVAVLPFENLSDQILLRSSAALTRKQITDNDLSLAVRYRLAQ